MVGGAVFCNPYATGQALIAWSLTEWHLFDGWAQTQGLDLFKVSCPRFINIVYFFLIKDLDSEGKTQFELELESIQKKAEYNRDKALALRLAKLEQEENEAALEETEDKIIIKPNNLWQAPEGWTPPGWKSDEENYQNAMALMQFQANPIPKKK